MKKRVILLPFAIVLLLFFAGCVSGPKFSTYAPIEIPRDRGLVYIYRPASGLGFGVDYDVKVDNQTVVKLKNGGYFACYCSPGRVGFWAQTEVREECVINVEAGKAYYLRGTVTMGLLVGHPKLELIPEEQGLREISQCSLLPAP